ncbi:hypothetical protein [Magnetococcus sp. PR-3]|uniref:hypothetical protein n=1 Tax=Magnetococcus sp. PR-3 TaxID=3120355 RepID=UPI002FCE56BB
MDTDQHNAGGASPDQGSAQEARDRRAARKKRRMKGIAAFRAAAQEISDRARQNREAHERGEDVAADVRPTAEVSQPTQKVTAAQEKPSQRKAASKPKKQATAQGSSDPNRVPEAASQPVVEKREADQPTVSKAPQPAKAVVEEKPESAPIDTTLADNLLVMDEGSSKPMPEPVRERQAEEPLGGPNQPPISTSEAVRVQPVEAKEREAGGRDHDVLAKLVKQKLAAAAPKQKLARVEAKLDSAELDEATVEAKPVAAALDMLEKASRDRAVELERHLHDDRLLRPQSAGEGAQDDEQPLDATYLAVRPRGVKVINEESGMPWPKEGWGQSVNVNNNDSHEESQPVPAKEVKHVAADQTKADLSEHPWPSGLAGLVRPVASAEEVPESQDDSAGSVRKASITLDEIKQRMLTLEPEAPWLDMGAPKSAAEPKEPVRPVPQASSRTVFDQAPQEPVGKPLALTPTKSEPVTTLVDTPPSKAAPSTVEMDTLTQRLFASKSQDPWQLDAQVAGNLSVLPDSSPVKDVQPASVQQSSQAQSDQMVPSNPVQHHPEVSQQRQLMDGWMDLLTTLPVKEHEVEAEEDEAKSTDQDDQPWLELLNQQPAKKPHDGADRLTPVAMQEPKSKAGSGCPWLSKEQVEPAVMASLTILEHEEVTPPSFVENLQQSSPSEVQEPAQPAEQSPEPTAQETVATQEAAVQGDEKDQAEQRPVEKETCEEVRPKEISLLSAASVVHRKKRLIQSAELRQLRSFMGDPLVRGPWGVEREDPFVSSPHWRYRTVAIQRRKKSLEIGATPFESGSLKTHRSDLRPGENRWGEMFESLTSSDASKQARPDVDHFPPSLSMEMQGTIFNDELLGGMDAMRWHLGEVSALNEHINLPCSDDEVGVRRSGFRAPAQKQHAILAKSDALCFVGSPFDPMKRQTGRSVAPKPLELDAASTVETLAADKGLAQHVDQFEQDQQLSSLPQPDNLPVAEPVASVDAVNTASEPVVSVDTENSVPESVAASVEKTPQQRVTHISLPAKVRPSATPSTPQKPSKRLRAKVVRRDKPQQQAPMVPQAGGATVQSIGNKRVTVMQPQRVVKPVSLTEQISQPPNPSRALPVDQYVEAVEVESLGSGVANLLGDAVGGVITSARWTGGKVRKIIPFSKK